jgi:cytochrome c biogenesis protein CcdA
VWYTVARVLGPVYVATSLVELEYTHRAVLFLRTVCLILGLFSWFFCLILAACGVVTLVELEYTHSPQKRNT